MRCLYCGKELALLKRWTSGGEFCSDAHRQQYQEEYNQLALTRLLQAKPQAEAKAAASKPDAKPPMEKPAVEAPAVKAVPAPEAAKPAPQPALRAPDPQPEPVRAPEEEPAPAQAGFFPEIPTPATAGVRARISVESEFERNGASLVPSFVWERAKDEPGAAELVAAGKLPMAASSGAMDSSTRVNLGRLDLRESAHPAPLLEFALSPAGATELVEQCEESMDLIFFPQPPSASPALWTAGESDFVFETETGSLARLFFRTTGIDDNESGDAPSPAAAPVESPIEQDAPPAKRAAEPAPARAANEPAHVLRPVLAAKPPAAASPAIESKAETTPAPATKPLPMTLHGLAAGRGKPVQVFSSAVAAGVDLQVPRSNALPLRPVMVLEPAAAAEKEPAPASKPEPKKRQDPRSSNGKTQPEKKIEAEKPAPVTKAAVATAVKEPQPVSVKEPPVAKPVEPLDLGLPSLNVEAGGSFWTKLPMVGKAGVGLAAALAIGGLVFALSHGGNTKAATTTPQIVEGPALSAVDSGWITDWGAEPGVRREHDISVLRPSLNLTDYRLQFEAQIDTKALGWLYRAKDGKNYYVNKLEIVKPGLSPTVALVRFAVINGQEQSRAQTTLNMPLHLDTLYKVRFDAVGDRFTTYVQDQKVDEWTDDRLKMGGVGLYNDRGERMSLKGSVNVAPLVIRK